MKSRHSRGKIFKKKNLPIFLKISKHFISNIQVFFKYVFSIINSEDLNVEDDSNHYRNAGRLEHRRKRLPRKEGRSVAGACNDFQGSSEGGGTERAKHKRTRRFFALYIQTGSDFTLRRTSLRPPDRI